MKKIVSIILMMMATTAAFAQWKYDTTASEVAAPEVNEVHRATGMPPSRWFFGGGLIAGFGSNGGAFGVSPLAGYKLNDYLDAGLGLNLVYNYNRARYWGGSATGEKNRAFNVGVMPFLRAFPLNNIFAQLQFEQAWVNGSYRYESNKYKYNYDYQALIASLGYANRVDGRVNFFISVGLDLLNNKYSPYRYSDGRLIPVISTGVNF